MDINALRTLAQQVSTYILVAGGIGVGKSHVLAKAFPDVPILDIDNEMANLELSYNEKNLLIARKSLGEHIKIMMDERKSLIAMGTASDTSFTINRLFWAKQAGYKTILFHVTCPLEQALKQNRARRRMGKRAVPSEDEFLLTRTMTESDLTVGIIKHTDLVDHYYQFDNTRGSR